MRKHKKDEENLKETHLESAVELCVTHIFVKKLEGNFETEKQLSPYRCVRDWPARSPDVYHCHNTIMFEGALETIEKMVRKRGKTSSELLYAAETPDNEC